MKSLKITLLAVTCALRYPRVWLTFLLLVTLPAIFLVQSAHGVIQDQIAHHPGVEKFWNEDLDADLQREHGNLLGSPRAAAMFFLLVTLFLGGGVLACLGVGRRFRYGLFLTESARLFLRNVRVYLIGLVPLLVMVWVLNNIAVWLRDGLLRNVDPGGPDFQGFFARYFSLEFGVFLASLFIGFLVLLIMFASRVARAWLVLHDRSSAVLAWSNGLGRMLKNPVTSSLTVGWFVVLLLVPTHLVGKAVVFYMERDSGGEMSLWLGYACGLGGIAWLQIVNVAMFIAARRFLSATGSPAVPVGLVPIGAAAPATDLASVEEPVPVVEVDEPIIDGSATETALPDEQG